MSFPSFQIEIIKFIVDLSIYSFSLAEGAFKKLKPEPNSGLSSLSGGVSSPGSGISSLPQHAGHTPTTASCPTPARRRHRTTFTQVSPTKKNLHFFICIRLLQMALITILCIVNSFENAWK